MQAPGIERGDLAAPPISGSTHTTVPGPDARRLEPEGRLGDEGAWRGDGKGPRGEGATRRDDERAASFRTLLQPRRPARGGGAKGDEAPGIGIGGGPTAERPPPVSPPEAPVREVSLRGVTPPAEVARLLVGQAHTAREARIELCRGPFAGSAFHLVAGAGGVEVRLGAPTEVARLALAGVLDRVGLHLRSRGIVMRSEASLNTGSRQSREGGGRRRG